MTSWIQVPEETEIPVGERPAYLLRSEFELEKIPTGAKLVITAQGIYTAFLNGQRVGRDELTPGYTDYGKRIQRQEYDVTNLLVKGSNAIAVELADGWFRGAVGITQQPNQYGDRVALFASIADESGRELVATDEHWKVGRTSILQADLFQGQHQDLRLQDRAAYYAGYVDHGWSSPVCIEVQAEVFTQAVEPTQVVEYLRPKSITQLGLGVQVVDFGQNSNGWVRLSKLGPRGTKVTITHGEWLDANGDVTLDHLNVRFPGMPQVDCKQIDSVISDGDPDSVFEPRYTTHGFQFVRVEGLLETLTEDDIASAVVHTNLRRIGYFNSSDERLNWLHNAATWSFRGNACDVPTDCPTRERSGWSGDWQIFSATAAYLFDTSEFNRKFLADARLGQFENGVITNIIPVELASISEGFMRDNNGSSGWGDVIVESPLAQYRATGDLSFLKDNFESMTKWVDFAIERASTRRHPSRMDRAAEPHERYLWDDGFHWGEWLEPSSDLSDFGAFLQADKSSVATAYLYRSSRDLAEIARILGEPESVVDYYLDVARNVKTAWQKTFLAPDGSVNPPTQATYVRALHFGLLPEALEGAAAAKLAGLIRDNGTRLDTGFLSTVYLLPTLADFGYSDLAFELLYQNKRPSWMYMRERGATTVWESWNGIDEDGVPHESLNHYSKGAVVDFLHQYVAGLKIIEPGYRRFAVKPHPAPGLEWASTSHHAPVGLIEVEWRQSSDTFSLEVVVPIGASAEVTLPDGTEQILGGGAHLLECAI